MTDSSLPDWNAVRFTPQSGDHVESYFLKATAPDAQRAFWVKATIFAAAAEPERAVAEGWAIAFYHRSADHRNVAVKHTVAFADASFSDRGLAIDWHAPNSTDAMHLEPGATGGAISTGRDTIGWDLSIADRAEPFVPFPYPQMYTGPLPSSKTVTPAPDARFSGHVDVGEDRWEIAGWKGMQGHNWGRGHAEQYAWSHCNQWDQGTELFLEALSARVRVGPLLTPVLTVICVRHQGVDYSFNRPLEMVRARGDIGLRRYTFSAQAKAAKLSGLFEASVEDFVGLYYRNPRGAMTYCLNSKLAAGRIRFEPEGLAPVDLTTRAAALEVGTKRADHGVKMAV